MRMIAVSGAVNVVLTRAIEAVNVVPKTRRLQARPVSIAVRYTLNDYAPHSNGCLENTASR